MNKITLDATTPKILVQSETTGGDYGEEGEKSSTISLDGSLGEVSTRNDNGVAQMSASGVFCNNAGTQAVAASTGLTRRAAIVGLGYGKLDKELWSNENFLAGVYGTAYNRGTAPCYGGYFNDLLAAGFLLTVKSIDANTATVYLSTSQSAVLGLSNVNKTVYLPNDAVIGRIVIAKNLGTANLVFYPRSGQVIYDDDSQNDYYEVGCGQMAIFMFVKFYVNSVLKECWAVSRFKF